MDHSNETRGFLGNLAREINVNFPSLPKNQIGPILLKYMNLEPSQLYHCVIRDLFLYIPNYPKEVLKSDVAYIQRIFPNASKKEVAKRLLAVGNVISRIEIVVKELLEDKHTKKKLKRRSDNAPIEKLPTPEQTPSKKQILDHPVYGMNGVFNVNTAVIEPTIHLPINNIFGNVIPSTSRNDDSFLTFPEAVVPLEAPIPLNLPQPEIVELDVNSDVENQEEVMDLTNDKELDTRLLYHIMEMFPTADPQFLREQVKGREFNENEIDNVVDQIFNTPNYPKRRNPTPERDDDVINPEIKMETLRDILPDADPTYLMSNLQEISTEKEFQAFVMMCLEQRNYPTYKEYLRKQQLSAQVKQYTTEFSVEKFVELIPDPEEFFNGPKCKAMVIKNTHEGNFYIYNFLRNLYPKICIKQIKLIFENSITIAEACERIKYCTNGIMRHRRKTQYSLDGLTDIPLLQVFAYLEHKDEILEYIQDQKSRDRELRETAKKSGLLQTCGCCYDDEVMHYEEAMCEAGCVFCKNCVEQSVKILFYEQKLEFPCLLDCGSKFGIQTLQRVLKPKIFSKLVQKKQLQEIKAAGIEDIEFCPFCDFATIVAPENKLFVCLNPDCMKESCRLCKETSHIPLRCDEIEKDEDVKNRIYIENKMSEALIRKCYKCELTFIKADGCNKMTCSCGAMMCYICNKPVDNYKHFNGQGGTKTHLCPLYSDTIALHRDAVLKSAAIAKMELGEEVKIDPTVGLEEYYKEEMRNNPNQVPPGMP